MSVQEPRPELTTVVCPGDTPAIAADAHHLGSPCLCQHNHTACLLCIVAVNASGSTRLRRCPRNAQVGTASLHHVEAVRRTGQRWRQELVGNTGNILLDRVLDEG